MKILVALDNNPYNLYVVHEAAKLAMNTWADITLLGIESKKPDTSNNHIINLPIVKTLTEYRKEFLAHFSDEETSPYSKKQWTYEFIKTNKDIWEEICVRKSKKEFRVKIRFGPPVKELLDEAEQEQSDLIILGCNKDRDCSWDQDVHLPEKIILKAPCSVLLVKEEKQPNKILCCLEHDRVSQESLELIKQMVTLYNTELIIVGLAQSDQIKEQVNNKMNEIVQYYKNENIKIWASILDMSFLDQFISDSAEKGLIALWMGHRSILEKFFSTYRVKKLIKKARSSVLILK